MDCHSCQPSLVDLLCGELAPDVADAARDHIGGCASCRSAFERLQSGQLLAEQLELEEPPQKVSAHLLQLAEEHAAERVRARASERTRRSPWTAWMEWVRRFAMAPQVGMATIMLLIVAFGLWSVPELSRAPEAAGDTVVNPDPEGEARATPGVRPAEPLDLEVDMRRRRIRTGDEVEEQVAARALEAPEPPAAAAEAEPLVEQKEGASADDVLAELEADAPADLDVLSKRAVGAVQGKGEALGGLGRGSEGIGSGSGAAERLEDRANVGDAFPRSASPARARQPRPVATKPARRAAALPAKKKSVSRSDDLLRQPYAPSSQRARSGGGDAEAAAAAEGRASDPVAAARQRLAAASSPRERRLANLELARLTRRQSGCAAALPHYQRAVAGGGRDATTGDALIEMALCQRQLGREAQARSLLEGAAQVPAVAVRARRLLGDTPPEPAATEAAPAAAPAP